MTVVLHLVEGVVGHGIGRHAVVLVTVMGTVVVYQYMDSIRLFD